MAKKFVRKRIIAPKPSSQRACERAMPTTQSGGTSEMAMATPGSVSPTSARLTAKAPAAPEASAA